MSDEEEVGDVTADNESSNLISDFGLGVHLVVCLIIRTSVVGMSLVDNSLLLIH